MKVTGEKSLRDFFIQTKLSDGGVMPKRFENNFWLIPRKSTCEMRKNMIQCKKNPAQAEEKGEK
jgi:hypothetical protein